MEGEGELSLTSAARPNGNGQLMGVYSGNPTAMAENRVVCRVTLDIFYSVRNHSDLLSYWVELFTDLSLQLV